MYIYSRRIKIAKKAKYVMGVLWVCYGYPMGEEGKLKVKRPILMLLRINDAKSIGKAENV